MDEAGILRELNQYLPEYMVPSILVHLDQLPLTLNGKLDRAALPDPEFSTADTYIAPGNELEAKMCAVYAEVLGLDSDKVGITDNFFRLGGNSILVLKLVNKLKHELGIILDFSSIYTYSTVEKICNNYDLFTRLNLIKIIDDNKGIHKPNLILFHTARGSSEVYNEFVEHLREYFKIFLVNSYNLSHFHSKEFIYDFNELCDLYSNELNQIINTNEKTFLGGWSFGGLIAINVMNKLFVNSEKFAPSLILFDTFTPEDISAFALEDVDNSMDKLYPSLAQKVIGSIHDQMAHNFKITLHNRRVRVLLIKAMHAEEFVNDKVRDFIHNSEFNGWDTHFDNIISHKINTTHEKIFSNNAFIAQLGRLLIEYSV